MKPVLFRLPEWLGGFPVPSYGLMMILAPLVAAALFAALTGRRGVDRRLAIETVIEVALVGIVAGRIAGLLLVPPGTEWSWRLVMGSGGVWYFGFLAGLAWFCLRCGALGLKIADGLDHLLPAIAVGHALGRVGCFLAGCCWGAPCELPWAVTFPAESSTMTGVPATPVHPVQLYEAFIELGLGLGLSWYLLRRRRFPGEICLLHVVLYGAARFGLEGLRADFRGSLGPLSTSQALSLLMLVVALPLLLRGWRRGGLGVLAEFPRDAPGASPTPASPGG